MLKFKVLLVFLLLSGCCSTLQHNFSSELEPEYSPEFGAGDCAIFDVTKLKERQHSEKILFFIRDIGTKFYFVESTHPKVGFIITTYKIRTFDFYFNKIECSF